MEEVVKEKRVTPLKIVLGPDGFIEGGNILLVPERLAGHLACHDLLTCQGYTGMGTHSGSHYIHYTNFNISVN